MYPEVQRQLSAIVELLEVPNASANKQSIDYHHPRPNGIVYNLTAWILRSPISGKPLALYLYLSLSTQVMSHAHFFPTLPLSPILYFPFPASYFISSSSTLLPLGPSSLPPLFPSSHHPSLGSSFHLPFSSNFIICSPLLLPFINSQPLSLSPPFLPLPDSICQSFLAHLDLPFTCFSKS